MSHCVQHHQGSTPPLQLSAVPRPGWWVRGLPREACVGKDSPGREVKELPGAPQNFRAATVRSSQGCTEVCAPVDANLPVVQVARPRVLVVSLLN